MAKKVKGLRVSKDLQEKFKFKSDGTSILGDSTESSHEIKGTGSVTGSMEVEGVATLKERLSGYTFSPPHIDASAEVQAVQDLIDNAAATYEGFLIYITNAAAAEPFNQPNKFYFCEDGEWFPSPFSSVLVNTAPQQNGIFSAISTNAGELLSHTYAADFFTDADADALIYTAELVGNSPLPTWLTFDDSALSLVGTPTSADEGTIFVEITATDPGGLTATISQQIDILPETLEVLFSVGSNSSALAWQWNTDKYNFHDNNIAQHTQMNIKMEVQDTNGEYVNMGGFATHTSGFELLPPGYAASAYLPKELSQTWSGNAPSNANDLRYPQMFGNTPEWGDTDTGRLIRLTFFKMVHNVETSANEYYASPDNSPLVYLWDVYAGTISSQS